MQKVFEDIVERLEECTIKSKDSLAFFNECGVKFVSTNKAIEIVNKVAEEYKTTISNDLEIVASLPSLYPMMQDFEEEAILNVVASVNNDGWIPVEERYPDTDNYILLSFSNFSIPIIGRYEEDENGGAFYCGDEDITLVSQDLFVNAWMLLVKPYRPEEE